MTIESTGEQSDQDFDQMVAELALKKLTEMRGGRESVLLSALGNRLSTDLGSLRQRFGRRTTLRRILQMHLGDRIEISGSGSRVSARLVELGGKEKSPKRTLASATRRYDKTFWAAFAKPVRAGARRFIYPMRPYDFKDEPEELATLEAEWIEVESTRIPSQEAEKKEREIQVHAAIEVWCARHGLDPERYIELPIEKDSVPSALVKSTNVHAGTAGIEALRRLVEAVPAEDRNKLSLPLDLIHALVTRS